MSRMNQVMKIGDIGGDIHYYIEDYAYTYLKKQKGKEKAKYFLYGEKEENNQQKKLYIYGIAEKPKMEQTYFKEYYPLGFLKIKNDETFWITLKGQEQKMTGFYVFYAPNQAMQEYLVDHQAEEKTDKPEEQAKRQLVGETLPMKETLIPIRKIKRQKNHAEFKNEKFIFPIGGIIIASLILLVLTSTNGQKKIEVFRQVIAQTMSGMAKETTTDDFIIEEKNILQEKNNEEERLEETDEAENSAESLGENSIGQMSITQQESSQKNNDNTDSQKTEPEKQQEESMETVTTEAIQEVPGNVLEESISSDKEDNYEEYVVKDGDTLVAICKTKYGSLTKMEEICTINNIKNADYIAPGQKIYLP